MSEPPIRRALADDLAALDTICQATGQGAGAQVNVDAASRRALRFCTGQGFSPQALPPEEAPNGTLGTARLRRR